VGAGWRMSGAGDMPATSLCQLHLRKQVSAQQHRGLLCFQNAGAHFQELILCPKPGELHCPRLLHTHGCALYPSVSQFLYAQSMPGSTLPAPRWAKTVRPLALDRWNAANTFCRPASSIIRWIAGRVSNAGPVAAAEAGQLVVTGLGLQLSQSQVNEIFLRWRKESAE
jgi:hypothetical protein